jgi:hypothetical protein
VRRFIEIQRRLVLIPNGDDGSLRLTIHFV